MILVNGRQISIFEFPNKERKITLPKSTFNGDQENNVVLWQYENDGDFVLLRMLDDWIERNDTRKRDVCCVIISMPYERMDRSEDNNVFSLSKVVELLPFEWNYHVLSPHSKIAEKLIHHNISGKVSSESIVADVIKFANTHMLQKMDIHNDTALIFPDKGAYLRYHEDVADNMALRIDKVIYGEKVRDFNNMEINSLRLFDNKGVEVESLEGTDVIVIDDLSSYGGTFVKLHEKLEELQSEKKFLILEKTEDSILKGDLLGLYDGIYTTDLMMNIMYDPSFSPELHILPKHEIISKITKKLGGFTF